MVSDQVDDCATQCVIGSVELLRILVFLSWNVVSRDAGFQRMRNIVAEPTIAIPIGDDHLEVGGYDWNGSSKPPTSSFRAKLGLVVGL